MFVYDFSHRYYCVYVIGTGCNKARFYNGMEYGKYYIKSPDIISGLFVMQVKIRGY